MKYKILSAIVILSMLLGPLADSGWVRPVRAAGNVCYVDDTAAGANSGADWTNAFTDLQLALADVICTEIRVAAGTYRPTSGADRNVTFRLRNNTGIYGGYPNGGGDSADPTLHETILSGDIGAAGLVDDNSVHVVTGSGTNPTAVLDGFTIRDGNASAISFGAAVYIDAGSPRLQHLLITANVATAGGGMHFINASPSLNHVTFAANRALLGGGLSLDGGSPSLTDVIFSRNHAPYSGGVGGGMHAGTATPLLNRVTFTENDAEIGGGMYSEGDARLQQVTFENNHAYSNGGGLYIWSGSPILTNITFRGNSAAGNGGGIYSMNGVPAENSVPRFTNLLLVNNSAYEGAGMMNYLGGDAHIFNATIAGNIATSGGSVMSSVNSSPVFTNVVVWGNPGPGPDFIVAMTELLPEPAIHHGILEEAASLNCSDVIYGDPLFVDPADGNYEISPDSPAVDAGDALSLPADSLDLDADGDLVEPIPQDLGGNQRVVMDRLDLGAYEAQVWNVNWPHAAPLSLDTVQPDVYSWSVDRYLERQGQSRWFKFTVQPGSQAIVTLTGLPANYDLALYKDISLALDELNSSQELLQLSAEFAADTFSPDTYSPDTYSPDTYSPDTYSADTFYPDTYSPDTYSPDTYSPDTYSPDTYSPDTYSPDTYSPDTYSPDTYSPDTYSPDTYSPDTYSPDTYSPDTYSSAQTRSLIAVSAHEGTLGEGIIVNTWTKSGDFYLRVRGRYGVYDPNAPFHLSVTLLTGVCGEVSPVLPASDTELPAGDYQTLILMNLDKTAGTTAEKTLMRQNLAALAARTRGWIVDVGLDSRVSAASGQAESHASCVYAMNLQAGATRDIADRFRALNPGLEYVVLVGNDRAIPFFRYADAALLASELEYSPPVLDNTTSQASLKSGYILSQDAYGAAIEISSKAQTLPIPDLAVGRLVEAAADINHALQAYLGTADGTVVPTNALVTGYDFLADTANAVRDELSAGLAGGTVDTLIASRDLSPEDTSVWTASDLRAKLLAGRHDVVFLAGHFSANSALAADYRTRLAAGEVLTSTTNLVNSLVYSVGCHSGYNVVDEHGVPNVTEEPDWAEAFAAKGATFIGGTGYQYGDTDFIEYSERLYLEFTRQLRYGSGPVAVGKALTQAKQTYLANTPLMRGIHEKSLLEATLFGLPMMQINFPARIPAPEDASLVDATLAFSAPPGGTLGLQYVDLHLTPELTEQTVLLYPPAGGDPTSAVYLQGPDGVVVNPAEPVLPLDMVNVTAPDPALVLRGIGWRGGAYTDLLDLLPLTGAATEDLRAPHLAFFSEVFYPLRPWNANYFDALTGADGATRLAVIPAQYRSTSPGSETGTLRSFDSMDFRLYYSGNTNAYSGSDATSGNAWTNIPALSAPPEIVRVASSTDEASGAISFEVTVTGDPAAGIQEVWIVYTNESGPSGIWLPLDLRQDPDDSRLWKGTLENGDLASLRFVVQAVNGVGLVTMMTNDGAYYRAGVDTGGPAPTRLPVTLTLDQPAGSGPYGGQQAFAVIATLDGAPVVGLPLTVHLGGQGRLVVTDSEGRATATFVLVAQPGGYTLNAVFDGDQVYSPAASADSAFEITPGASAVVLEPAVQHIPFRVSVQVTATVTCAGLPLTGKPVALTLNAGDVRLYTSVAVTDYAGRAHWQVPGQALGSYTLKAWFGQVVSSDLDLSSPFYAGADSTASLIVDTYVFRGFFAPVNNPPAMNKANAGSSVPIKFSLGGDAGLQIFASGYPLVRTVNCKTGQIDTTGTAVIASTNGLIYDPLTGLYTYVWKTDKKWANSCRALVIKFIDGTEKTALFQLTK